MEGEDKNSGKDRIRNVGQTRESGNTVIKLTEYKEETIGRGTLLRCKGQYPYEEVVDFLVCESRLVCESDAYVLIVASGHKAGLPFCCLPKESIPVIPGQRYGCLTKWLIENWTKWGYGDCSVEDVWIVENSIPNYPC